ncbi:MAG TPA: bifunctional aspartate kinase/homoserine dehydrogenase I, partial [Fodinibius sp.]|nr:bifunctional aspartate kinase/homoserine dehydrogenase I [Fodinibius sp.]
MRILKFGGSSVSSASAIRQVLQIIAEKHREGPIHVVVSALQGVTDQLERSAENASHGGTQFREPLGDMEDRHISLVRELVSVERQSAVLTKLKLFFNELDDVLHGVALTHELTDRIRDFVLSFGERLSAFILANALQEAGVPARFVDARDLIKTDHGFGGARVNADQSYANIREQLANETYVGIITGFIGSTEQGVTTTLGRGGSDYTAALFGAALDADAIEKWSDVEGIMTADPRMVGQHQPITELSYEEAMELSHFGATVMYPPTVQPAMERSIPILIKNTFSPDEGGTVIKKEVPPGKSNVKGVSSIDHVSLITLKGSGMVGVSGFAARIFSALAQAKVNIIMITQASSEHTVCFAVLPGQSDRALQVLNQDFKHELEEGVIEEIQHEPDCSIVAAVGDGMKSTPGISGQLFRALGRNGINVRAIAQGSSERNISVVVKEYDLPKTLNTIHNAFFLSKIKTVNLFLIGIGLIGSKLLELFEQQADLLYEEHNIKLNLCGIANSSYYKMQAGGLDFKDWSEGVKDGKEMKFDHFLADVQKLNLPNSLMVDCTASAEISNRYSDILKSSFSLVTANKKANSGPMERYQKLQELALKHNVMYLYETNVGAGLPVVKTLKEQVLAGDKITKIEGVLSGTLSYIFNVYDGKTPF